MIIIVISSKKYKSSYIILLLYDDNMLVAELNEWNWKLEGAAFKRNRHEGLGSTKKIHGMPTIRDKQRAFLQASLAYTLIVFCKI